MLAQGAEPQGEEGKGHQGSWDLQVGLEGKSLGKVRWEGANARARKCVVEHSMRTAPLPLDSWETSNQVAPEGKLCDRSGFYFFIHSCIPGT